MEGNRHDQADGAPRDGSSGGQDILMYLVFFENTEIMIDRYKKPGNVKEENTFPGL